jgi:RNA polymerase sigma factor (sigma-70 family)
MNPNTTSKNPDDRLARFDECFRENYEAVRRHAVRCGSHDSDDIASECFAALWRRLDDVGFGVERAWLLATVRKMVANERRAVARRDRLVGEIVASTPSPASIEGLTDTLVADSLATLSRRDQEVLVLEAWDGLSSPEIARVLGLSRTAAAVRLHRARRRFRDAYVALSTPSSDRTPLLGGTDVN